jgi:hypothetical protein
MMTILKYKNGIKALLALAIACCFVMPGTAVFSGEKAIKHEIQGADFEMWVDDTTASVGETGKIIFINGSWAEVIQAYQVYMHFDTTVFTFVEVDFTGTVGETANYALGNEMEPGVLSFGCVWFPPPSQYPQPGSGILAKVVFNVKATAPNGDTILDLGDYLGNPTVYTGSDGYSRDPVLTDGIVTITGGVEPNQPPYVPSNPHPVNGATGVSIATSLTWTGGDPDGDSVTYDVYFGVTSPPLYVTTVSNPSYNPGALGYETSYFWKIVASDGEYDVAGPIWGFTTRAEQMNDPPLMPRNPNPPHLAQDVPTEVTFSWDGGDPNSDDMVYYCFAYGKSPTSMWDVVLLLPVPATQTRITFSLGFPLEYGERYYWQITAMDDQLATTVGPIWRFDTGGNNPPHIPQQPQGTTTVSHCKSYSYSTKTTDAEADMVRYCWDWGDGSALQWSSWSASGATCSLVHTWNEFGTFSIRVKAEDDKGAQSDWSTPLVVNVINNNPYHLWAPQPLDGATDVSIMTQLQWLGGDPNPCDTVQYAIYFGTSSNPPMVTTLGPYPATQTTITYSPGTLAGETTYYWKIIATDNLGASITSPIWQFTTEDVFDITIDIVGNGHVDVDPLGPYVNGTAVMVTAVADTGWTFQGWSGDLTSDDNPLIFTVGHDIHLIATFIELIPDIDGDGDLSFTDVKPGSTVTGEIMVMNVGEPGSLLNWEIESYPEWGTWTFDPESDTGLTPAASPQTIDVSIVAPEDKKTEFTGTIKVVNTGDSSDYFEVSITLVTPQSQNSLLLILGHIFERFCERFPLIASFISSLYSSM